MVFHRYIPATLFTGHHYHTDSLTGVALSFLEAFISSFPQSYIGKQVLNLLSIGQICKWL